MTKIEDNDPPVVKDRSTAGQLGDSFEDVKVELQSASAYAQGLKKRQAQMEGVKHDIPVGGAAPPLTPDKIAQMTSMAVPSWGDEELEQPQPFQAPAAPPQPAPTQRPMPTGVGSGYQVNQDLASGKLKEQITVGEAKRRGMGMAGPGGNLSPESKLLLENLEVDQGLPPGRQPVTVSEMPPTTEGSEETVSEVPDEGDIDFDAIDALRNTLVSTERKEIIEARLVPLNIADLIVSNEIRQTIPVIPGQLEYEIKTFQEYEHLFCMQYVYDFNGSPRYIEELFNTAKICCSIVAINGKALPEHRASIGQRDESVDKEAFAKKIAVVSRFATQLLADLGVQTSWFNERVNGLFDVKKLKNG
jgi:hypothetical protein